MLFNSIQFIIFLPIVLLVYYIIPDRIKYLWLLAASYYFYMCWNAKYAILILLSTIITYLSGLLLDSLRTKSDINPSCKTLRRIVVLLCVLSNLSILFFFKYTNFVLNLTEYVFNQIGITLNVPVFDVLLPVGISFYTFQALGYTIDVYRGEIYAEKSFFRYALFVSFFPQLVAGPIERSKNLLKQLSTPHKFSFDNFREGVLLMLWGYFLKLVIADRVAIFVDNVYGYYYRFSGYYIIVATILFAFQIYCDFAGYSIIAMGSAKILGIQLMENFNTPYLATSVSDFWRRWHISLTSWFKDYLYIPLGGNRKGKCRKYINKFVVFCVSGLWHGASISFIIWGALNGLYQIIEELTLSIRTKLTKTLNLNTNSKAHKMLQALVTFVLIDFSWVFFRAKGVRESLSIIKSAFGVKNPWVLFDSSLYDCGLSLSEFWLMIVAIFILLFVDCCKHKGIVIRNEIAKQDVWFRCLFITLSILIIMTFGKYGPAYDSANFIYFQF